MRVKILDAISVKRLEEKVNEFLEGNPELQLKDMQITSSFGSYTVLIQYEER